MKKGNVGLFISVWVIVLIGGVGCQTKDQIMSQLGIKNKTTNETDFKGRAESLLDEEDNTGGRTLFGSKKKKPAQTTDDDFIHGSLRDQLKLLKQQRAAQAAKASESVDKAEEFSHKALEYKERLSSTDRRIEKLKKIINALDNDELPLEDAVDGPAALGVDGGTLLESSDSSLYSSGGPFAAPNAGANMAEIEPIEVDPTAGWTNANDDAAITAPPVLPSVETSAEVPGLESFMTEPEAAAKPAAGSTSIVALSGKGLDAVAILGKGQAAGVQKGALFSHYDAQGRRTILQVTDVYPTTSRAIPHPLHSDGALKVDDAAVQVGALPE